MWRGSACSPIVLAVSVSEQSVAIGDSLRMMKTRQGRMLGLNLAFSLALDVVLAYAVASLLGPNDFWTTFFVMLGIFGLDPSLLQSRAISTNCSSSSSTKTQFALHWSSLSAKLSCHFFPGRNSMTRQTCTFEKLRMMMSCPRVQGSMQALPWGKCQF